MSCNKCRQGKPLPDDTCCLGCSAWESLGTELCDSWANDTEEEEVPAAASTTPKSAPPQRPPEPKHPPTEDGRESSHHPRSEHHSSSGKKRKSSGKHRGGRNHQKLYRVLENPNIQVHRRLPALYWDQRPSNQGREALDRRR